MGKASRGKWERRLQALLAQSSPADRKLRWYENNTAQFLVGLGFAIVLTVVAAMVRDLRWLLWLAWLCFSLAFVPITANIFSRGRRVVTFVAAVLVTGIILHTINGAVNPELSDQQLCMQSIAFAQRMRDFARERDKQQIQSDKQYDAMRDAAKPRKKKTGLVNRNTTLFSNRWTGSDPITNTICCHKQSIYEISSGQDCHGGRLTWKFWMKQTL